MMHLRKTTEESAPRAIGSLSLSSKARGTASGLNRLRSAGCMKVLFPRKPDRVEAIMINTAGGLTGGDHLTIHAEAGAGSCLSLTTQAAERAYRSASGAARVETHLTIEDGGRLLWLPQELILFEGCALERTLSCDIAPDGRLLMVEPVVFGRAAMGERLRGAQFNDRIEINRGGQPIYRDALALSGDIQARLDRAACGAGAGAMVSLVYVAPDAEAHVRPLRALLPESGGVSLLADDILVMRLVAADSHLLRQALLPVLDRLSSDTLPNSWRL